MRPLVLISNDDGIDAPAMEPLCDEVAAAGLEPFVIAPERQRSAASHQITLHKPLRVTRRAENRYAASGSPADCVYIGVNKLLPRRPAVVISGINDGYNLGSDVFYSGTVAAAAEGGLRGLPGIAVSLAPGAREGMWRAAKFAAELARVVAESTLPPRTVLNVNVPPSADAAYAWTCLGDRSYIDDVQVREDPRGKPYYWIGGGEAGLGEAKGSDTAAILAGLISVTPLYLDLTCRRTLDDAPGWDVRGFQAKG
jgi:5'-nucleotidase